MTLTIELRCILFLLIIEMFLQLDWSPPLVNSERDVARVRGEVDIVQALACFEKDGKFVCSELCVDL